MPRPRVTRAVRSAALICAASSLLACEQQPDVVISTALDAGKQPLPQQQQDPPMMNDDEACQQLLSDNFWLTRVFNSEAVDAQALASVSDDEKSCVLRSSEANAHEALNEHIFSSPPADVGPEKADVALCSLFDNVLDGGIAAGVGRYYPWPEFMLPPPYLRLCPGYCESLRLWIEEHDEMVLSCHAAP